MTRPRTRSLTILVLGVATLVAGCTPDEALSPNQPTALFEARLGSTFELTDGTGTISTYSESGSIDQGNPFFQSLGTNGRSCGTCHLQGDGFGLSAASVQAIFAANGPTHPLFAPVDGANCPNATPADGAAGHSLLLNNGLIRIGITVPKTAEFTVTAVHDPYGCALTGPTDNQTVSMYRRPLPTSNLRFLSAVMFDGRETVNPLTNAQTFLANLRSDLAHQAMDATLGHAQALTAPTNSQVDGIVNFELALFTAQSSDNAAGTLNAQSGHGGPERLAAEKYYPGINDPLGDNPTGAAFNDTTFSIYAAWEQLNGSNPYNAARKSVARGELIFNTQPVAITDVKGLNDDLGVPVIHGTCTTCHDSPNIGNHSRPVPLDIGTSHPAQYETSPQIAAGVSQLGGADYPIFQMTCTTGPLAGTVTYTSDPGRAMISGRCKDIGRVKGPILRGLPARAPYFHNGAAATLTQVVAFYNQRFNMGLSAQQQTDLIAFLQTL